MSRLSLIDHHATLRDAPRLVLEAAGQQVAGKAPPLSPKSVDTYRSRPIKKLGINDIAGLVKWAIRGAVRGRSSWMTADGECP